MRVFVYYYTQQTERHGRVVNIPALYSEVSGSKHGLHIGQRDWVFSCFFEANTAKYHKLGHDRFLTQLFQVIIHVSSFSFDAIYIPSFWKRR
jgi:hypothetical protein